MMIKTDLRFRIAAVITTVCVVLITLTGLILYAASEELEQSLVEQLVSEELNFLVQHHQANPDHIPETSPSITYYVVTNAEQQAALPTFVHGLPAGVHDIDIGSGLGERHIGIRQVGTSRYVVIYDLGPYEEREEEFKWLVAALILAMILVVPFISIALSNFLVRQLNQLTQKVATLSPQVYTEKLYQEHMGREVGILAQTLDAYQERIRDMLQREQEFTADVSHELRTPLTEIRTSCELLSRETQWTEKTRARIDYIARAEKDMRDHMEALLFLARDQTDANKETVALHECIQDIVTPLRKDIASKSLTIDLSIDPQVSLQINRKALHLVVFNILKNAINSTDAGGISFSFKADTLAITDTGIGIADEAVNRIFDRRYRGDNRVDGFGIGLDIVKKICEHEQWTIRLESALGQGTTFHISFG